MTTGVQQSGALLPFSAFPHTTIISLCTEIVQSGRLSGECQSSRVREEKVQKRPVALNLREYASITFNEFHIDKDLMQSDVCCKMLSALCARMEQDHNVALHFVVSDSLRQTERLVDKKSRLNLELLLSHQSV